MPAGSKPGERRGGRQKGTKNKVTRDLAAAARNHTDLALRVLLRIMRSKTAPESAQVAAVREMFDRGYGKASQSIRYAGFALDVTRLSDEEIAIAIAIADRLAEARSAQGGVGETRLIEGQLADRPEPGGEPGEVQTP